MFPYKRVLDGNAWYVTVLNWKAPWSEEGLHKGFTYPHKKKQA